MIKEKAKNIIVVLLAVVFVFGFTLGGIFLPDKDISKTERRKLAKFPQVTFNNILSGKFMTDFESYSLDHFPLRDGFRGLKSFVNRKVMLQKDNNGYYSYDGYIIKSSYPIDEDSVSCATSRFEYIYESYLKGTDSKIYLTIVPDKNCFVPESEGYLAMDYTAFSEKMVNEMGYAKYIDIFPLLELSDYYATDTHWRQEEITDVAQYISKNMGVPLKSEYTVQKIETPFYGVYHGQFAMPVDPDELYYLTNDILDNCVVTDLETNSRIPVYDMNKIISDDPTKIPDPYEIFLSGPNRSILVIDNKNSTTDKELIIFRDSYANAIAPLFVEGYSKITLIDLRRVSPQYLGNFVEFTNQDVLFLQSTLVLNDSSEIK